MIDWMASANDIFLGYSMQNLIWKSAKVIIWIKLHVHYYFQRKIEKRAEHIQVETKFNSSK
jgi:hypothetical protein